MVTIIGGISLNGLCCRSRRIYSISPFLFLTLLSLFSSLILFSVFPFVLSRFPNSIQINSLVNSTFALRFLQCLSLFWPFPLPCLSSPWLPHSSLLILLFPTQPHTARPVLVLAGETHMPLMSMKINLALVCCGWDARPWLAMALIPASPPPAG